MPDKRPGPSVVVALATVAALATPVATEAALATPVATVAALATPVAAAIAVPGEAGPRVAPPGVGVGEVPTREAGAQEPQARQPAAQEPGAEEHAAEEHPEEAAHAPGGWDLIYRTINFALLLGLLYWMLVVPPPAIQEMFSYPGLRVILGQRRRGILEARELAERQKAEAARRLQESEGRLARLEQEIDAVLEDARSDAVRERARADEEARARADKIRETARRDLRAETLNAQRRLRGFVADLAVGMAEGAIRESLGPDDQRRLVDEYLSRLEQGVS